MTVSDINPQMLEVGMSGRASRGIEGLTWSRTECRDLELRRSQLRCLYDRVRHPQRHRHPRRAPRSAPRAEDWRPLLLPRILDQPMARLRPGIRALFPNRRPQDRQGPVARDEDSYRYLVESIERFPGHEPLQEHDRECRLPPRSRPSRSSAASSPSTAAGKFDQPDHSRLAAAEVGPGAGPPWRPARHRARSEHAGAGAPPRPASPGLAPAFPPSPIIPKPSRRSARRRSSSARHWRRAPTWSARMPRATSPACRTICRPPRSRRSRRRSRPRWKADRIGVRRDRPRSGRRRVDRAGPPRHHHRRQAGRGESAAARHRGGFARALDTYEWAAAQVEAMGGEAARLRPPAGHRHLPAMDDARARPQARGPPRRPSCAKGWSPKAASSSPRSIGAAAPAG